MAATLTQKRFTGSEWVFERSMASGCSHSRMGRKSVCCLAIGRHRTALSFGRSGGGEFAGRGSDPRWRSHRHLGKARSLTTCSTFCGSTCIDVTMRPLDASRAARAASLSSTLQRALAGRGEPGSARAARAGRASRKRRDAPHEHRRSPHWLKMKCELMQSFVVGGFTDPQGGRVGLGALLVGHFDHDGLLFAGKVGTGLDTKLLLDLRRRLDALQVDEPPFTKGAGLPKTSRSSRWHWVRPEIVVDVAFIEWTVHGKLRHPRLLGVRGVA